MGTPDQPPAGPGPAPCGPDSAVDRVYDRAQFGLCANGHPLNKVGRCAVVNDHATDAMALAGQTFPDPLAQP